jgi:hypothetical protein
MTRRAAARLLSCQISLAAVATVFLAAATGGSIAPASDAPPPPGPTFQSASPVGGPQPPVDYLSVRPSIDGVLDAPLRSLPARALAWASPSAPPGLRPPTWRLAYSARDLYLYVEFDASEAVVRDRAYQNGDGLIMVLSRPRPDDSPTDEFYALGVSAGEPAARWQRRFVWYRNRDLSMQALDAAEVATTSSGAVVGIEFLLPWGEVYPHHAWLGDIGFNLCVTRAPGATEEGRPGRRRSMVEH